MVTFDPPSDPEDEDEPNLEYDYDPASASDHYTRFCLKDTDVKKMLMEEYGWPDNFRREAWQRDHERI